MSSADVTSARSSPTPETCPECDATASVTSDLHKYQVACTCKPGSVQYACADDPGPPPPVKTDTPPALPPRPPTSVLATSRRTNTSVGCNGQDNNCRRRKYAWWCVGCGALAAALGGLLAAQHILVRAYTASPHHLETVPAAVPAAMLVLTGVCIMSLARRRNRYSYMVRKIKVVGACCLICALTCVLVTITTTVIHMNKLQTLKFCDYTKLTRTCTCFSMPPDSHSTSDDEGVRCVFEGVSGCGVVHGALYWCLRGVFALSVSAVLVCIFSCMLAYQLLSHERKKMYWEQLELRCRSLYRPPSGQPAAPPVQSTCNCCTQCHPTQPAWDISLQHRFWAPGRIGNLYSPNPGTGRKTSAWSWFPWPRSNSQNSRCRMGGVGVPQSGDSAYGFCETDTPSQNPQPSYEERPYPNDLRAQTQAYPGNFSPGNYPQGSFPQGSFGQGSYGQGYQEGFGEASGSFDATTGVWGPPPPYSPQGRSGSRHHLHQDPASATLLHHHHIDHTHTNTQHTCNRNSYLIHERNTGTINPDLARLNPDLARLNPDLARLNPDLARLNPDLARLNPDLARLNPDLARLNPDLARLNPDLARLNPDLARLNPDLVRINPDLARMNPDLRLTTDIVRLNPEMARLNTDLARLNPDLVRMNPDLARLNPEMVRMSQEMAQMYPNEDAEGSFNTLRGHLVPYRCQRLGMSAGNLHRDCTEGVAIECLHQKSASKVSDQSSDSCQKQGKENLGFQNDKHSPIRSSMQDCRGVNQNAESEVYFADVSSCCNVSVKAECCMNPTVSALVGTIESHAESTSESEGSFTLTRQQRPQPQVGSKRRQQKHKKQTNNNPLQTINNPIQQINSNQQINIPLQIMNNLLQQQNNSLQPMNNTNQHMNNPLQQLNNSLRLTEQQIEQLNLRMNECRMSEARMNESRDRLERLSDSRNEIDRMNESRMSERERMNERLERMNEIRMSERLNESRGNDSRERLNDSRMTERMNDTRMSDRMNDSRVSERMNDTRMSDRINESRIERMNDSRHSGNESRTRMNDSLNDSRMSERMSDLNSSIRIEGSPKIRSHISPIRRNQKESRPINLDHSRQSSDHSRQSDHSRLNLDHSRQSSDHYRPSNLDHSRQTLDHPRSLDHPRQSLDHPRQSLDHPRQSSLDSKPEFFVPPPPLISPLSPKTDESLLSDDNIPENDSEIPKIQGNSKTLAPDSQYEQRDEKEEILKSNHHHCYSDTNTMDSGWQSGSEKQVTD